MASALVADDKLKRGVKDLRLAVVKASQTWSV